jgi:hypothetical protein
LRGERGCKCSKQFFSDGCNSTAEHHGVNIYCEHEKPDRLGEVARKGISDTNGVRLTVAGREEQGTGGSDARLGFGMVGWNRPRQGQRSTRCERLKASSLPTGAQRSVRVDRDMTDLSGCRSVPTAQLTVENESGSKARSDAEVGKVGTVESERSGSAKGCSVDVVLDRNFQPGVSVQMLSEGQTLAADTQVDGMSNEAAFAVDEPRHADTDGAEF